jgi:hypothetical protein
MLATIFSISVVASADCCARILISSATVAKLCSSSPTRDASKEALRAKMLV